MAGAIGWALTQPPAEVLAVFAALGLGLAAPFTLFAFIPAASRWIPKPSGWMAVLSGALAAAFAKSGAVYLKADWTNPDAAIAKALADQGRSGVPLYLVYGRDGAPAVLPQILTEGTVVGALEKAKAG